ncbi:MAG: nicotinamide mononucleotide transporter [Bacteroidales bacterium]|nr:nicotinamide mononucleotide transporter [Bacteroidales bacterium]
MEGLIRAIELFAFVTGIAYIILEICQKNAMWIVGIATGVACAFSFGVQNLWASMGLNIYYVFISVWGLVQWKKAGEKLTEEGASRGSIHLSHPDRKTLLLSLALFIAGSAVLIVLLRVLNDSESALDAVVAVMSAIATWWLAKSWPEQWLVWILADTLSTVLCLSAGMYWMAVLYAAYAASAVYGWLHWKRRGVYVE